VQNAQQYTINFSENNLLGKTAFFFFFDSCKARVAATVGMMTTGYDCADLLNIVFMRPVFSPSDFIQMKGRGTRLYTFHYTDYSTKRQEVRIFEAKTKFRLLDFCGVCEYFEEKYDYEKPLLLKEPSEMTFLVAEPRTEYKVNELGRNDKVTETNMEIIGKEGMRVDREMFGNFQKSKQVEELSKLAEDDREKAKEFLKKEVFDKPQFFMNLDKLRKIFGLDRYLLGLDEALDLITGKISKPKHRQELLKQYFAELIIDKNLGEMLVGNLYDTAYSVFDAYITNEQVRKAIDKKEYGRLAGTGLVSMADLRRLNGAFQPIIQYINDYVPLDKLNLREVA
jgi:type I restriction enzyme R subunit